MFKCEKCGAGSPEDCKCGKPERQPEVKFKEIKVNKQEYHIEENGTNHSRTAVIYFREGRFDYCKYELPKATSDRYGLEDWEFLKFVSERILALHPDPRQQA